MWEGGTLTDVDGIKGKMEMFKYSVSLHKLCMTNRFTAYTYVHVGTGQVHADQNHVCTLTNQLEKGRL